MKTVENLIILENQKEGTSSFLIKVPEKRCEDPEHYFCRRPQIEGYCSKTSYLAGDTLSIFISTDPVSDYTIDIYRMGYYGGKGGRLMKKLGPLSGKPQVIPEAGPNNLIECRWDIAYQMTIPKNWLSGVYLGKLTALADSSQAYIIFIVKDERPSEVVFQCSDLTWQAYNRWPYWHSMYDEGQNPWVNTNGARISYDRPYSLYVNFLPSDFNGLSNGSGEFLLWEFSLAFWLEKEGYDVSYISNTDTHADPATLTRGKTFISVGHDEYWTPQMVENVSMARDKGVSLLFLSGNSVSRPVYLDSSSDGRSNRITGRLPEKPFDDEAELMGNSSYGVGYSDYVCTMPDHWIYEGTGMQKGDKIIDLVGWEYHGFPVKEDSSLLILARNKIFPNKFGNPDAEDHAATIYTAEKGNFVFNAGTCFWSLPLSSPPGFQNPVNNQEEMGHKICDFTKDDSRVQQITRNLLAKALGKGE